jgi:hypothetical protein
MEWKDIFNNNKHTSLHQSDKFYMNATYYYQSYTVPFYTRIFHNFPVFARI